MILTFVMIAAVVTLLHVFFLGFIFWRTVLIFACSFLAVNLAFFGFWTAVALFINTTKPISQRNGLSVLAFRQISSLALGYAMVRVKVYGEEKLPKKERFLLVCNHVSLYDPLIIFNKLASYELAFISKTANMALPIFGKLAYGGGCIGMDRENDRNALRSILQAVDYMKRDICSMSIFPEGTRNKTKETLLPFHAGSFKIAQKANAPVAIACIKGTGEVKKNIFRRFTDTEIDILDVIPAENVKRTSTKELARYSSELIKARLEQGRNGQSI